MSRLSGVVLWGDRATFWALLAAVAGLLAYVLNLMPTTYLLDSSELVATTVDVGISHPPGHPAFHMLAQVWLVVPLASLAVRIHLFGALCVGASVGFLVASAARFGWLRGHAEYAAATALAVLAATSAALAFQAVRAEVYALQLLAVAVLTWLFARPAGSPAPDAREAAVAGVATGVALLNHHYLTVFAVPALLAGVLAAGGGVRRVATATGIAALFSALPLVGYLYLVAADSAVATWGWPSDLGGIWWFVSAAAFQRSLDGAGHLDWSLSSQNVVGLLTEQLGPGALILAICGLGLMLTRHRAAAVFLGVGIVANIATQALMAFDPANPDVQGYFMAAVWWLALSAVFPAATLTRWATSSPIGWSRVATAGLLIAVMTASAQLRPGGALRHGELWESEQLREADATGLDPGAVWVPAYFETMFRTWYGRAVEDWRPDVAIVPRGMLTHPAYAALAGERLGQPALIDAARAGRLVEVAQTRTVVVEPETIVGGSEYACATACGLSLRLSPVGCGTHPDDAAAALTAWAEARLRVDATPERQTARNLLWSTYQLASAFCATGRPLSCGALAAQALEFSPNDPDLRALYERAIEHARVNGRASGASRPE